MVFQQGSGCQRVFKDIPGSVMMVSRGVPAVFRGCSWGVAGMFQECSRVFRHTNYNARMNDGTS